MIDTRIHLLFKFDNKYFMGSLTQMSQFNFNVVVNFSIFSIG